METIKEEKNAEYIIPIGENAKYVGEKFKVIQEIIKVKSGKAYREKIEGTAIEVNNEIKKRLWQGYDITVVSQIKIPVVQNNPYYK